MAKSLVRRWISDRLVSARSAWVILAVAVVLSVGLIGLLGQVKAPGSGPAAPADSESMRAAAALAGFPDADQQPVLVVASRLDDQVLTDHDQAALRTIVPLLDDQPGGDIS